MNETVEQVIAVIRENRRRFEDFCFSLSEDQLSRPVPDSTWIVKDFASHLDTLDTTFLEFVGVVESGGSIDMARDAAISMPGTTRRWPSGVRGRSRGSSRKPRRIAVS